MIGEFNLVMPFSEEVLNNKKCLTKFAKKLLGQFGTVKNVVVERVYVFGTGSDVAILCYKREGDDEDLYRGGMRFKRCDVDTPSKAVNQYIKHKDMMKMCSGETSIHKRKPLLIEANSLEVLVEMRA